MYPKFTPRTPRPTRSTVAVSAPYPIGPNGTGFMSAPRKSKIVGEVSVMLTATGKEGQTLWQERRLITEAQAAPLFEAIQTLY